MFNVARKYEQSNKAVATKKHKRGREGCCAQVAAAMMAVATDHLLQGRLRLVQLQTTTKDGRRHFAERA